MVLFALFYTYWTIYSGFPEFLNDDSIILKPGSYPNLPGPVFKN